VLKFTCGRPAVALATLAPFERLPEDAPLRTFRHAFEATASERYEEAIGLFEAGIAADPANELLNSDVRSVLKQMRQLRMIKNDPPPAPRGPTRAS
jgi:hypothetical protein